MFYKIFLNKKNNKGPNKDGNISKVLNSLIFKSEKPDAAIKKPPTIDSSTTKAFEKKLADKNLAIK